MATLTYVYSDSTVVLGPLATYAEPHSYDLCSHHAGRLTAPRGWEIVRLAPDGPPPPADDLLALADAVREVARSEPRPARPEPADPTQAAVVEVRTAGAPAGAARPAVLTLPPAAPGTGAGSRAGARWSIALPRPPGRSSPATTLRSRRMSFSAATPNPSQTGARRRRGRPAVEVPPLGSLTQREHRAAAICRECGSQHVTRLAMSLTDGTPVEFTSCHTCEHRTWEHAGVELDVQAVLERTRRP